MAQAAPGGQFGLPIPSVLQDMGVAGRSSKISSFDIDLARSAGTPRMAAGPHQEMTMEAPLLEPDVDIPGHVPVQPPIETERRHRRRRPRRPVPGVRARPARDQGARHRLARLRPAASAPSSIPTSRSTTSRRCRCAPARSSSIACSSRSSRSARPSTSARKSRSCRSATTAASTSRPPRARDS